MEDKKQSTGDGHLECIQGVLTAQLPPMINTGNYDIVIMDGAAQWVLKPNETAIKWGDSWEIIADKLGCNEPKKTENPPIVDIMAITRSMCK